jgi:hypothetical protein
MFIGVALNKIDPNMLFLVILCLQHELDAFVKSSISSLMPDVAVEKGTRVTLGEHARGKRTL